MRIKLKRVFRFGLAPALAIIILLFIIVGIVAVIMSLLKPELLVATLIALGAFFVLIAIFAGPSLVKAAIRR